MSSTYLFDKIPDLKEKFKNFFSHKKKMQALDNYSYCAPFQHRDYLLLIKKCMLHGFLGEKEADFLCYMVEKYAINFLDWSHKTNWLKQEMNKLASNFPKPEPKIAQLPLFDYEKMKVPKSAAVSFGFFGKQNQLKRLRAG